MSARVTFFRDAAGARNREYQRREAKKRTFITEAQKNGYTPEFQSLPQPQLHFALRNSKSLKRLKEFCPSKESSAATKLNKDIIVPGRVFSDESVALWGFSPEMKNWDNMDEEIQ